MPLSLRRQRNLGYGGRKHPWRRGIYGALSRAAARFHGGGLVFAEDDVVFRSLLADLGRRPAATLEQRLDEVREDRELERAFDEARAKHGYREDETWSGRLARLRGTIAVYYALLRELRPSLVVETGTAAGGYTAFVAAALHKNGHGRLVSIDIPAVEGRLQMKTGVPPDSVGYFIPRAYRERWTYTIGDAKLLLPRFLAEEKADVFIHDSLHTRTHMLFEYSVARALMAEGSLIASDDILWNDAFNGFLAVHRLTGYAPFSSPGTGAVVNRFDRFERESGLGIQDAV